MKIKNIGILTIMLFVVLNARSQYATTYHDGIKMNQITVMETGVGNLTNGIASLYYTILHNKYTKDAAIRNKATKRATATTNIVPQVGMSEVIDSSLVSRFKIEELNIADRSGGVLDLAWLSEGDKVENSLKSFKENINRLSFFHDGQSMKSLWQEEYDKMLCAIKTIQDAYMPNHHRQRQYINIYNDIEEKNKSLIKFIVAMKAQSDLSSWEQKSPQKADLNAILSRSYEDWSKNSQRNTTFK